MAPAFRRAKRHSFFVRTLRTGIPASIVVALVLYGLVIWFKPLGALASLPSGKVGISGTKITMDLPKLAGYTRDGRSYELTATAASQDLRQPQLLELQEIKARLVMRDGGVVSVHADAGLYDTKTEAMTLRENVLVSTASGTEVRMIRAALDLRKGHVLSDQPVQVLMPTGRVDANAMEVSENGALITFQGGVKMEVRSGAIDTSNRSEASQ
jgi:lipopolysaccharide export system protein LptC